MSESLNKVNPIADIIRLAEFTGGQCGDWDHRIVNSTQTYPAAGLQPIFSLTVSRDSAIVITALDIKSLSDPDAAPGGGGAGNGDWRSSFDINPFGPFGGGAVGLVQITVNGNLIFPACNDIGLINAGIFLVFQGGHNVVISADPQQAAGTIVLVSRINCYKTRQEVGTRLTKSSTILLNAVPATFVTV
jgi:hypothetical protein